MVGQYIFGAAVFRHYLCLRDSGFRHIRSFERVFKRQKGDKEVAGESILMVQGMLVLSSSYIGEANTGALLSGPLTGASGGQKGLT